MINRDIHKQLKLSSLVLACGLSTFGMGAAQAVEGFTLTFADNTSPAAAPLPYVNTTGTYDISGVYSSTAAANTNAFAAGNEFRMISASGAVGGGGEKTITDGFQEWHIAPDGTITTTGTDITPTSNSDGLWQGADFFFLPFGFVNADPTAVMKDFTVGTISFTWANGLVAEWGGTFFPLGDCDLANQVHTDGQGCGITLSGTMSNIVAGSSSTTFDFVIHGEHRITPWEDTAGDTVTASGFAGWNAEWELSGSGEYIPPATNVAPNANAGSDQTVIEGDPVTLDGSGSSDTDGTIASYSWTQPSGTTVTLSDATSANPTFTAPTAPDSLTFELEVTDNEGATGTDTVVITVNANQPPVADAGVDQSKTEGSLVTLDGSGSSDADGTIASYNWTQTSGASVTLSGETTTNPTFTAPAAPDSLVFLLTVTDDRGSMGMDSVAIGITAVTSADDLNARNDAIIMDVGAAEGTVNVLSNDSGDTALNVSASDGTSMKGGTVTCSTSGACTYNPPSSIFTGADKFSYTASDGTGSDSATVYITVASVPTDGTVLTFVNRGAADLEDRYSLLGGIYVGGTFTATSDAFDEPFTTNGSGSNSEFRMIAPGGNIGGGGEKSNAGQRDDLSGSDEDIHQWVFDASNTLDSSGFIDTDTTPVTPQDSPSQAAGAHTNAIFFEAEFGFQLLTGATGQMNLDLVSNTLTVTWPQGLNAHWGGRFFPLGEPDPANECNTDGRGCGISMSGPVTNVVTAGGLTTFDFKLFGEVRITAWEDTERDTNVGAGFAGWRPQWELTGSGVVTAPLTAPESPSADNGTIGPTPGSAADGNSFNDGRVTLDELTAAGIPVDTGVNQSCVGSCFAITVSGMTQPSVEIILPLSSLIPANAVYRKFIDSTWRDFITSTGDTVESADSGGGTCAAAVFTPGLTQGDRCVRLTIADGGPNDADGLQDNAVTDPGGVAITATDDEFTVRPGTGVGSGCSLTSTAVSPPQRAEWWLLAGFIAWLGWRRKPQQR